MKVLHVTIDIAPESGGPTRSIKGICRSLARSGVNVGLLALRGRHEFENSCGVAVFYGECGVDLHELIGRFDFVHIHALWHLGLHRVVSVCRKAGVPYVISPRGMLDPWALSVKPLRKRIARILYQDRDLRGAAAFHATAELEAEEAMYRLILPVLVHLT